jgi:sialidase-1
LPLDAHGRLTIRARTVSLIALIAAGTIAAAQAPRPVAAPRLTDVYAAGEGAYHTYRIPSIIATPKGTLLAFAEARREGAADAGDIDLVLERSRDLGATWLPMQVIGDDGPNTVGNPCPVVDSRTGTIWLLTTHNLGTDREKDIIAGTSRAGRTVWAMKSDDDGATWSAPVEISSSVKRADWTWYATGPGVGIQLTGGRLVIPANHAEAGSGTHRSHVVYSDDDGTTWRLGASADAGTNESQVVELADGSLMLNMRNHPPQAENYRVVAISPDRGQTLSSGTADRTLIEPPAQASILRLTDARRQDRNRLLFANPAANKRERMTVRVSYDEGRTWPVARVIHEGPSAYSSLVVLPGGNIGLLFERGDRSPYERITFAHLTLDWLSDGKDRIGTTRGPG